jgi:ketosteroid isomerase-like protein
MAVLRGLLALLCVVSSAESQSLKAQSFQRVALASCRLPGVDGEAHCGSYEVHVVARYGSHRYSTNFSPRVDQLMADFITRGGVKGLDTSCIDRIPQIPFRLSATQSRSDPAMSNNDETQLRQLENEWLGAYFNGDKAAYDRIVADDATLTDESAVSRSKAQDRSLLPPAPIPGATAVNEDVQVRLYGETAVVTGRIVTTAGFTSRFTDTWLKRQGHWQVVARHYSRVPIERKAIKLDAKIYQKPSQVSGNTLSIPGTALA